MGTQVVEKAYGDPYHREHPLTVMDFETTGTNPLEDRPVSVAVLRVFPDGSVEPLVSSIINPGVEVPEGAAQVHGITTEHVQAFGRNPAEVIGEVVSEVEMLAVEGRPLLIYNVPFDWPMLQAEAARAGLSLPENLTLFDPLCIHKAVEPYFKGGRKLERVASSFGVDLTQAHDAVADCRAAAMIGFGMIAKYAQVHGRTPTQLMAVQRDWHAKWAIRTNEYWQRTGRADRITAAWPSGMLE